MTEHVNEETGEITDDDPPITKEQVADAEAEEAAEEEAPEPESVADEAVQKMSDREREASQKRIDKAVGNMVKVLQTELADSKEFLMPCPRCADDFPGLIWNQSVKGVLPETRAAVMVSMGEDPDPTLNPDPRANRCAVCDGWGKVSTGSRVHRQDKLECSECKGRGWIGPRAAELPASAVALVAAPSDHEYSNGNEAPQTDPWGRMKGEALYGVMPGYES